jgi:hypothetical protein
MKLKRLLFEVRLNKGSWIDPQGKIHDLGNMIHAEYAMKYFRNELLKKWSEQELDDENKVSYEAINVYLIMHDYVRTADLINDTELYLEIKKNVNDKIVFTLEQIIIDNEKITKVLCYFYNDNGTRFPKEFNNPQDFLKELQK